MKKTIELADTTFRAYKKRNGATVLHLRTHLIVYADADFRRMIRNARPSLRLDEPGKPYGLSAFMKEFPRCWLKLAGTKRCECEVGFCPDPEYRSIQHPTGDGWVTMSRKDITDEECLLFLFFGYMTLSKDANIKDANIFGDGNHSGLSIADMKLVFHINFPGFTSDKQITMRRKVPIVRRGLGW